MNPDTGADREPDTVAEGVRGADCTMLPHELNLSAAAAVYKNADLILSDG